MEGNARKPYVYNALEPSEFRLLQVDSCSDSTAICRLTTYPVAKAPRWTALSYVWGKAAADVEITLGGRLFWIRRNLFEALKSFNNQRVQSGAYGLPIWIDAICINQDDNLEKVTQIPLIRTIYMKAEVVFIWLGTLAGAPEMAIEVMSMFQMGQHTSDGDHERFHSACLIKDEQRLSALQGVYHVTEENLLALRDLILATTHCLQRGEDEEDRVAEILRSPHLFPAGHPFWLSWWSLNVNDWCLRVWTMQEALLAQWPMLLTPVKLCDWKLIQKCQYLFHATPGIWRRTLSQTTSSQLHDHGIDVELLLKSCESFKPDFMLHSIAEGALELGRMLVEIRALECSVKKDYIFGIVGLLSENVRHRITIDYSLEDVDVFTSAVNEAITEQPLYLGRLWHVFRDRLRITLGLPSWVPDFSATSPVPRCPPVLLGLAIANQYEDNADVKSSRTSRDGHPEYHLSFTALRLDLVRRCTTTTICFDAVDESIRPGSRRKVPETLDGMCFSRITWEWLYKIANIYGWGDLAQPNTAVSDGDKMPVENRAWTHFGNKKSHAIKLDAMDDILISMVCLLDTSNVGSSAEARLKMRLNDHGVKLLKGAMLSFINIHHSRFVFVTVSGRLGCSSVPLDEGDQILLVPGGLSLSVISANGDRYKGAAEVDGFMEDSLLTPPKDLKSSWEMFTLTS